MTDPLRDVHVDAISAVLESPFGSFEIVKHEHRFETEEDGVDRCVDCGVTFLEHTRGFGSNTAPRRTRG